MILDMGIFNNYLSCYLIASNCFVYSSFEPELNNSKKGFEFGTFDTIIVEVSMSMSKITWTN